MARVRHDGQKCACGGVYCGQAEENGTVWYRGFMAFPLLSQSMPFASALRLKLQLSSLSSPEGAETVDIFDVPQLPFTYEDLGTGTKFGTTIVRKPDRGAIQGTFISIDLTAAAVYYFNNLPRVGPPSGPGSFLIGLAVREPFTLSAGFEGVGFKDAWLVVTPKSLVPVEETSWGRIKSLYQ
jgi:hypothetical protein